jgi:multiple sugar transport system permease protein
MKRRRFDKHGEPIPSLRENVEAYSYLAPAAVVLFIFWALPVLLSLLISFRNWKALDSWGTTRWVGVDQYARAFQDEDFRQCLWNTVNYVIYSVPPTLALALLAAILLNTKIKFRAFFRTAFFLPYVTTWVAISIVWKYFFHREFGLANWFLTFVSGDLFRLDTVWKLNWLAEPRGIWEMLLGWTLEGVGILSDGAGKSFKLPHPLVGGPSLAMFAIVITSVWRDIGYFMIIYLAGLQNIDKSYYEAAEIDGAGPWQKFRTITWPLLSPITFFLMIISMIGAFKIFVPILVMTGTGGPDNTTSTIVFYLYEKGFRSWLFGYASAIAYILFIIILLMTLLQNRLFGKRVEYGN